MKNFIAGFAVTGALFLLCFCFYVARLEPPAPLPRPPEMEDGVFNGHATGMAQQAAGMTATPALCHDAHGTPIYIDKLYVGCQVSGLVGTTSYP